MEKIEKYGSLILITTFFLLSLGNLNDKLIGDEIIYVFPDIMKLSYLEFLPGLSIFDYFYGHPPGFPLLLRVILDLSSGSVVFLKVFALLISCLLLFVLSRLCSVEKSGIASSLIILTISTNQLFITHSTMIHPDILFITLGLGSWLAYQEKKPVAFALLTFGCLFVRESGLAFLIPPAIDSLLGMKRDKSYFRYLYIAIAATATLTLFFVIHHISYGHAFGNKELMIRAEKGFSLLSINKDKWEQFLLNLFIIKSFATTIPLSLFLYALLIRFYPNKREYLFRKFALQTAAVTTLTFWVGLCFLNSEDAFRVHHTLVNFNYLTKLIPSFLLFYFAFGRITKSFGQLNRQVIFSVVTITTILAFYYFYQDSSPRNLLSIIVLSILIYYNLLNKLCSSKRMFISFGILLFGFQGLWVKIPQIPGYQTHPVIYRNFINTLENMSEDFSNDGNRVFFTSKEFKLLFSTPLYGWNKTNKIKMADSIDIANVLVETNYYHSQIELHNTIKEEFSLQKTYLVRDNYFKIYQKTK